MIDPDNLVEGMDYVFTLEDLSAYVGTFVRAGSIVPGNDTPHVLLMADGTHIPVHAVIDFRPDNADPG